MMALIEQKYLSERPNLKRVSKSLIWLHELMPVVLIWLHELMPVVSIWLRELMPVVSIWLRELMQS